MDERNFTHHGYTTRLHNNRAVATTSTAHDRTKQTCKREPKNVRQTQKRDTSTGRGCREQPYRRNTHTPHTKSNDLRLNGSPGGPQRGGPEH